MNDLRLYLLAGHRPTSANDQNFFRAVLDRLMQHEHGFAVRRMPSGLNDRGLRAGQLEQLPQITHRLELFARQGAFTTHGVRDVS